MLKKSAWCNFLYYVDITPMCKNTTDQLSLVVKVEGVIGDAVVEIVLDMVHIDACIDRSSTAYDTTIVVYISTGKLSFNPSIYIHL